MPLADLNLAGALTTLAQTSVDANPAGGAAIGEAIAATAVGMAVTLVMLWVGWAHRTGRISWLGAISDWSSRISGMPGWAAVPSGLVTGSLVTAAFGMYWDISLHVSTGRDAGPFANPAHFFILAGLFGIFIAGFLAIVLPEGKPSRVAVRLGRDWWAPLGGIGLLAASAFALLGFPLDDFWHRIFGQDVTLWGPTHLMLLGGAALAFVGEATLLGESEEREIALETDRKAPLARAIEWSRYPALAGGFLIALSIFMAEFDFGVPQFRMVFGPILVAFAAGTALVAARIYGGKGVAIAAALFFLGVRGILTLLVGPIFGEPTPYFPLYLASAVLVEVLALGIDCRRRPLAFGAVAGLLIGTIGTAAEYGWTQVFGQIAWNEALITEMAIAVPVAAVASGVLGAWVANAWRTPVAPATTPRIGWAPAAASTLVVALVVGWGLSTTPEEGVTASVELTELSPDPERTVAATVTIDPPTAVEDANFFNITGWQGGGFHLQDLEQVPGEEGTYRSTEPIPVSGTWKSVIRIHRDNSLIAVPIFMPEDAAIPAPEVPAEATFTREFIADHEVLQREQIDGVAGWVTTAAYLVVGLTALVILILMGWSLNRLNAVYSRTGASRDGGDGGDGGGGAAPGGVPRVKEPAGA